MRIISFLSKEYIQSCCYSRAICVCYHFLSHVISTSVVIIFTLSIPLSSLFLFLLTPSSLSFLTLSFSLFLACHFHFSCSLFPLFIFVISELAFFVIPVSYFCFSFLRHFRLSPSSFPLLSFVILASFPRHSRLFPSSFPRRRESRNKNS